jgi:hypothetical protein
MIIKQLQFHGHTNITHFFAAKNLVCDRKKSMKMCDKCITKRFATVLQRLMLQNYGKNNTSSYI